MNKNHLNGELIEIGDDVDDVLEDTEAIDIRTKKMDKKIWLLVALWIIDKVIIYGMIKWGL